MEVGRDYKKREKKIREVSFKIIHMTYPFKKVLSRFRETDETRAFCNHSFILTVICQFVLERHEEVYQRPHGTPLLIKSKGHFPAC